MTFRDITDYCLTFPGAYEDYPFGEADAHSDNGIWAWLRHKANKKTFAHVYIKNGNLCVNVKCNPFEADILRQMFKDATPGFHMNKTHWNTIIVGGDVPISELQKMIEHSYELIKPKVRKKK